MHWPNRRVVAVASSARARPRGQSRGEGARVSKRGASPRVEEVTAEEAGIDAAKA